MIAPNHHSINDIHQKVLSRLDDVKERNGYTTARCPAHDDKNPSLSVREHDDGISVKCHAGCTTDEVLEAVGMTRADLRPRATLVQNGHRETRPGASLAVARSEEAYYYYQDENGDPLFRVRRTSNKNFIQQRHEGGEYINGLGGREPVLYHLDKIANQYDKTKPLFICEGEKDTDRLIAEGFQATTNPMGAGKWGAKYADPLRGFQEIYVLPDNDPVGWQHAEQVAATLPQAKIVHLPALPEKGDVSDWLDAGGGQRSYEDLRRLINEAPEWTPSPEPGTRNASTASNASNASDFKELTELPDPVEFPVRALPPTMRQFVQEAAAEIGCPEDYIGLSVLAAASAAIGDTRRIMLKRNWTEGAAIYAVIAGGPATKKTPAMNIALAPVRQRQVSLRAEYDRQVEEYAAAMKDIKNAKDDVPATLREPDKPTMGRTYADDATVERLADILNENPRGVLLAKDELSSWLGGMNQYKQGGKGSDRQFWLSAHSNQPISVDRKSSEEPVLVSHPFVSIIGGMQPSVFPDFGKDRGDGLIDRFLFTYPKPLISMWTDDEMSEETSRQYANIINNLYRLQPAEDDEGKPFPSRVQLTPEAKQAFIVEYNNHRAEMTAPGFPERLHPVWGKLEAYLARLALIIAMSRIVELRDRGQSFPMEEVTPEDIEATATLIGYFKNHARRVYTGLYGANTSDRLAADLREFLVSHGGEWVGAATELHAALDSDYKPERPEDMSKVVRGIVDRTAALRLEDMKRVNNRRPFHLTLENAGSAGSAGTDSPGEHPLDCECDDCLYPTPKYATTRRP